MIEDIRNRQKHPSVFLGNITPIIRRVTLLDPAYLYDVFASLDLTIANKGTLKSADTFLLFNPEQGYLGGLDDQEIVTTVRGTNTGRMWQLIRPLPPQSEISFRTEYHFEGRLTFHPNFGKLWTIKGDSPLDDVAIEWTVFADSAPPRRSRVTMAELGFISLLNQFTPLHSSH